MAEADEAALDTNDFAQDMAAMDGAASIQDDIDPDQLGLEEPEPDGESAGGGHGGLAALVKRWHPLLFLAAAGVLAGYAWMVYPRPKKWSVPPAEVLYQGGLDRLYRVINPDLPLREATPADEALTARNALMNLMVFHRDELQTRPEFINPHLLLGEVNRLLAGFIPALSEQYMAEAGAAYTDAVIWENRDRSAEVRYEYDVHNFLGGRYPPEGMDAENEEIEVRRRRRQQYLAYRKAETDTMAGRSDLARPVLEDIQRTVNARRREELRRMATDDTLAERYPLRLFELGQDDLRLLDYLLGRTYDNLGSIQEAKVWYLRFLSAKPDSRYLPAVLDRLGTMAMEEGEVYRRVDRDTAVTAYRNAIRYFGELVETPGTEEQRRRAMLGMAEANSRIAELAGDDAMTGIDTVSRFGAMLADRMEEFSGQPLPARTTALPAAFGTMLGRPELITPGPLALAMPVAGSMAAMAAGEVTTPYSVRQRYGGTALEFFDRLADQNPGTPLGDRARLNAAWESWRLGRKDDAERRFRVMLDPLSDPELTLAARLGLATVAMDRGDLDQAQRLALGGYTHPHSLWFLPTDADWQAFASRLGNPGEYSEPSVWLRIWETASDEGREIAAYAASGRQLDNEYLGRFLRTMNTLLRNRDFYQPAYFRPGEDNRYLEYILAMDEERLTPAQIVWRNRLLIEQALPYEISQRAGRTAAGFEPFPDARDIPPGGLLASGQVSRLLVDLGQAWSARSYAVLDQAERLRSLLESNTVLEVALDRYQGDPGTVSFQMARNFEELAEIREGQGRHVDALSLTANAARRYLDVSLKAQGSPREMDALLAAGDAFFRAGLLGRTVETLQRFMDRFGYSSSAGGEAALAVVRAENLLGRSYWFLNDVPRALESFQRNMMRRTPDRFKSIYYMGRVLMEEGLAKGSTELLGSVDDPLPRLDRNGNPVITSALQAFTWLRQSPGISPEARAWRWSTFDLAKLYYHLAERERRAQRGVADDDAGTAAQPWLATYDLARAALTEALDRYPLRRNGGIGISIRVEPEDYADVMASRFEVEYMLADTLLILAANRADPNLYALARLHLANLSDRQRYANALFDPSIDRFQLNAAVIREEVEGGTWQRGNVLPRTRLGDDEGPTHSPHHLREMLINSMRLLASEYFRAGEEAEAEGAAVEAAGLFRSSYDTYQDIYDRFGFAYGPYAMVGMGDALAKLGRPEEAANHHRMARNIADALPPEARADGDLAIGADFWGARAEDRLRDRESGFSTP